MSSISAGITKVHRVLRGFMGGELPKISRHRVAKRTNATFRENRGPPENVGQSLEAVHPVIRPNRITGWKGLFVNRGFTKRINGSGTERFLSFSRRGVCKQEKKEKQTT